MIENISEHLTSTEQENIVARKVCSKCTKIRNLAEFSVKQTSHGTICKECRSVYWKAYYAANRQRCQDRTEQNRPCCASCGNRAYYSDIGGQQRWCPIHKPSSAVSITASEAKKPKAPLKGDETKEWFKTYRSEKRCEHCGNDNPDVLDCHHLDRATKSATVSSLFNNCSLKKVLEEVEKCIFLCANCHGKVTQDEINSYKSRYVKDGSFPDTGSSRCLTKTFMLNFLLENPCVCCGESDIRCLDCDHIDPDTKTVKISDLVHKKTEDIDVLQKELGKCQILCKNCHRLKTKKDKCEKKIDSRNLNKRKYDALVAEVTK